MVDKFVLFSASRTQRVTVEGQENDMILISKEWRHSPEEEWRTGKGIQFPIDSLIYLGELLKDNKPKNMLNDYEKLQESNHDNRPDITRLNC